MSIKDRLQRLEQANRRMKFVGAALLPFLIGLGLLNSWPSPRVADAQVTDTPKVLKAREFQLVDENGTIHGGAEITPAGQGRLVLQDKNGKKKVVLAMTKDGPILFLTDGDSVSRVAILVTKDGPHLAFTDEHQKTRIAFEVNKTGPQLYLYDKNGNTRVGLRVTKDGPALTLWNETRSARVMLSTKAGPSLTIVGENKGGAMLHTNSLVFLDKGEKIRATLGLLEEIGPMMSFRDENSKPRIVYGVTESGPFLKFLDENGKDTVVLP